MYSQIDSNKRNSVILMMIFIIIIIGIGYGLEFIWGNGSYMLVWGAVIISLLMTSVSYFKGDKIALASSGAKQLQN